MENVRLYKVGGCVRDAIMGRQSKDIDYAVTASSFKVMRNWLIANGYKIFVESPQFLTIRARDAISGFTSDFVLCRKDGEYVDGRRPETVTPGTIFDDLARRDFTINAIAQNPSGYFIDPHNGIGDIEKRIIRAVGDPYDRFREDGLRVMRAIRFSVVFGFEIDEMTREAMNSNTAISSLHKVSIERVREELEKALHANSFRTIEFLMHEVDFELVNAIFRDGLRLSATTKEKMSHV